MRGGFVFPFQDADDRHITLEYEVGWRAYRALRLESSSVKLVYLRALVDEAMGGAFACIVCVKLRKEWLGHHRRGWLEQ